MGSKARADRQRAANRRTVATPQVGTARERADPALGRVRIRAPVRKDPASLTQQGRAGGI